jgi:DNA-binding MurR/RpiR family transcriptional regulator
MHEKGTHTVKQIAEVVGVSCATVHRAVSAS